VEVRLSANRARFEEFDFSEHNRTRLVGLVNDLANSYVNPVLQMLHFTPELRAEVLMGHSCEREFCLTCELGFLSHMLAQPPTRGAGSHSSSSATAQPLNFLRTLRQVREAAALGLIEGRDELETRLDQSKPRRVQAFQRFILEQLHKEDANGSASSLPANAKTKSSSGTAEKNRNRVRRASVRAGVDADAHVRAVQSRGEAELAVVPDRPAVPGEEDVAQGLTQQPHVRGVPGEVAVRVAGGSRVVRRARRVHAHGAAQSPETVTAGVIREPRDAGSG
jgi:hypothetical protein